MTFIQCDDSGNFRKKKEQAVCLLEITLKIAFFQNDMQR
jgi:hypothetical protein